jgi:hypothetical protein
MMDIDTVSKILHFCSEAATKQRLMKTENTLCAVVTSVRAH